MKFARFAVALPAVFLLGTAQLAAQEREQEMQTPATQQDVCQVTFYTVEADDLQQDRMHQQDMQQDPAMDYQRGQEPQPRVGQERPFGQEELPLRGQQLTTLQVQDQPLTLWAEFSQPLDQVQSVHIEDHQTGVQLEQAYALQALDTDGVGIGQDWTEREERVGEQDRVEHAGQQPGMPHERGQVEGALLTLNTSGASQGQLEVIFEGTMQQRCTGNVQVGEAMQDDFRRDEPFPEEDRDDPFDPEPQEDDPFDPDPEA